MPAIDTVLARTANWCWVVLGGLLSFSAHQDYEEPIHHPCGNDLRCDSGWILDAETTKRTPEGDSCSATRHLNLGCCRKRKHRSRQQHLAEGVDVNAKHGVGQTPLREAARWGHKEIAELLIAKGADVNAKTKYGYTPLPDAAYGGHKEIAELLIANGANVNAKTDGGFAKPIPKEGQLGLHLFILTPLDEAIRRKQTATADLLRKHGGKTGEELKATGN